MSLLRRQETKSKVISDGAERTSGTLGVLKPLCLKMLTAKHVHPNEKVGWNWSILAPRTAYHPGNKVGGCISAEPPL